MQIHGRRALLITVATALALSLWAVFRLFGIDMELKDAAATERVRAIDVFIAAALAGLAAGIVHAALVQRGKARIWPFVASTALSISMIGPVWLADGEDAVALIVMHLLVGAVLIAGFARYVAGRPTDGYGVTSQQRDDSAPFYQPR